MEKIFYELPVTFIKEQPVSKQEQLMSEELRSLMGDDFKEEFEELVFLDLSTITSFNENDDPSRTTIRCSDGFYWVINMSLTKFKGVIREVGLYEIMKSKK